jgi:hypothetical protein
VSDDPEAEARPRYPDGRWRVGIGLVWLGVVAAACFGALVHRSPDAGVAASGAFYLVFLTIPAIVIASALIQRHSILVVTAGVGALSSATLSVLILRATSKHAAIGILVTAMIGVAIAVVGCLADLVTRPRASGA